MQPKPNNFRKFITLFSGILIVSAGLLALNFYSKGEKNGYSSASIKIKPSPINLENFCQQYQTIGRNLQAWNQESLSEDELLVKTQAYPNLPFYLDAVALPNIKDKARKAKVPVLMYHDILPEKKYFLM